MSTSTPRYANLTEFLASLQDQGKPADEILGEVCDALANMTIGWVLEPEEVIREYWYRLERKRETMKKES